MNKEIAIIGGGAAGFFTAVNLAKSRPDLNITIYEGSSKLLSKVLISGGGRCNVTNSISEPNELIKNYPRGNPFLIEAFKHFSSNDTRAWFDQRDVPIKMELDGRAFPESNSSESIYNCLLNGAKTLEVIIKPHHRLDRIEIKNKAFTLYFGSVSVNANVVVLATGSNPSVYKIVQNLGIKTVPLVPSLFTFNAKVHEQLPLAGVSVQNAQVWVKEIPHSAQNGPLLITHWGYSGPSILRLSAWYARELHQLNYHFTTIINWMQTYSSQQLTDVFLNLMQNEPKQKVSAWKNHSLPKRLWTSLLEEASIKEYTNWSEIGKKGIARLVNKLTNYEVVINKKSTFKDEFVTAGGICLEEVHKDSFQLKKHPGLYAAGEILNVDAITGGFNFQAAWTGGYLIAKHIANLPKNE